MGVVTSCKKVSQCTLSSDDEGTKIKTAKISSEDLHVSMGRLCKNKYMYTHQSGMSVVTLLATKRIHIHVHVHIYTYIHTYMYMYTHIIIHAHTNIHTHTCT